MPGATNPILLLEPLGIHAMLEWSLWILFVAIIAAFLFSLGEPPLRRVGRINSRLIFGTLGIAGLAWAPLMWADYDSIAGANSHLEFELGVGLGVGGDTVEGLRSVSASTYFKPQADRFVVRAAPPVQKPVDGGGRRANMESSYAPAGRTGTIAVYVAALAISGRVTHALPHVERMRVFAVTSERYRRAEEIVQKAIKDEGPIVEPLRLELARWR